MRGPYSSARLGPVRAPVAARVEGDDAEVAGEVRDLQLPEARVDDRPRREQQDRLLALAEDLVGDADTADVGEAALVRERAPGEAGSAVSVGDHG